MSVTFPDDSEDSEQYPLRFASDAALRQLRAALGGDAIQRSLREAMGTEAIQRRLREAMGTDAIQRSIRQSTGTDAEGAVRQLRETLRGAVPARKALDQMRSDFFEGMTSDFREVAEEIGSIADEATLEEVSYATRSDFDPLQEAFFRHMASLGKWAQTQGPELSDRAIDGVNRLAAATLYKLVVELPLLLLTQFGLPGFVVGLLLSGQAEVMTDSEKNRLSPANRQAIDFTCPTCEAVPGMYCITIHGKAPGSRARSLHKPRVNAADQANGA